MSLILDGWKFYTVKMISDEDYQEQDHITVWRISPREPNLKKKSNRFYTIPYLNLMKNVAAVTGNTAV